MEEECLKDVNGTQYVRCLKCDKVIKCSRHDTSQLIEHIKRDHPEVTVVESGGASLAGGAGGGGGGGGSGGGGSGGGGGVGGASGLSAGGVADGGARKCVRKNAAKSAGGHGSKTNIHDRNISMKTSNTNTNVIANTNVNTNINFSTNANASGCKTAGNNSLKRTRSQKGHLFRTSIEHWRPANGTIYCPFCCCKKQPLVKMRNERLSGNSCGANCMLACWPLCFLPFLLPGTDKEYLYCANCKCFLGLYDKTNNCIRPNKQFSERLRTACAEAKK